MNPFEQADLQKLVSVAQAPVSLIIATSIVLHMLTSRYVPMLDRLRLLIDELRKLQRSEKRYAVVKQEIVLQEKRVRATRFASRWLSLAVVSFIFTVTASALSIIYPNIFAVRAAGLITMAIGLALLLMAICYEMFQDSLSGTVLSVELSEFGDLRETETAEAGSSSTSRHRSDQQPTGNG